MVPGHSMRTYSVSFDKSNPNIVLTGGWDERTVIWDLREETPIRSMFGTYICGDSIDLFDDIVLTASYREEDQLQQWDFGTGKLIKTIKWNEKGSFKASDDPCQLYCCSYSKGDGSLILAGGATANEAKLFDRNELETQIATVYDVSREINSCDFANHGGWFCLSGGDGYLRVYFLNIVA